MSLVGQAFATLFACACGWFAVYLIHARIRGMFTRQRFELAAAAAVGSLLPFVPDLIALTPLPSVAASALCAAVLAFALKYKNADAPAK